MKRQVVCFGAIVALILGGAGSALAQRPSDLQQLGQKGPYEVGFASYLLVDSSRDPGWSGLNGRPIPVYVWYPVDRATITPSTPEAIYPLDGISGLAPVTTSSEWESLGLDRAYQGAAPSSQKPFPLLMFSPGWGGPAWFHVSVGTRLASHGFVVAVLTHYGDGGWLFPWEPFDSGEVALYNRPRDVSFALTQLLAWNGTSGHQLRGLMRPDQVAAGGWSLGGYAAMALAGGDDNVCDKVDLLGVTDPLPWTCVPTPPDPRIKAIVPMDGSNQCLLFSELARIKVPAMGIGEEWSALEQNIVPILGPEWIAWQARQHAAFSGRPAYRVDVANTIHGSFSDMCETDTILFTHGIIDEATYEYWISLDCVGLPAPVAHSVTSKYAIAFLKTHLSGEAGYQSLLTPGWALTNESVVEFFVTERKSPSAIDEDWPDLFIYFPHQSGSAQARAERDPKRILPVGNVGLR